MLFDPNSLRHSLPPFTGQVMGEVNVLECDSARTPGVLKQSLSSAHEGKTCLKLPPKC